MAVRSSPCETAGHPETLADVLVTGPLPLAAGLRYANDIAASLRDLHQQTRAYGKVTTSHIILTESGAHLLPLHKYWDHSSPGRDVQAFGAVFFEMLTGTTPPAMLTAAEIRKSELRMGSSRLGAAAIQVVIKCLAPKGIPLTMQQVATEVRLLSVLLRQHDAGMRPADQPAPAPFLVAPPISASPVAAFITPFPGAAARVDPAPPLPFPSMEPVAEKRPLPGGTGAAPVVPLGLDSFGRPTPKPRAEQQPEGGTCPKCDSPAVYVSRARSQFELMLERWKVPICRCYQCYHRYVVFAGIKISKNMPFDSRRRFKPRRGPA